MSMRLKPSLLSNFSGGDIDRRNNLPAEGIDVALSSVDSFFTSSLVFGLYVENAFGENSRRKLENIRVSLSASKLDPYLPIQTASQIYMHELTREFSEDIKAMFGSESTESDFTDFLMERRLMNVPPFTPNMGELGFHTGELISEVQEKLALEDWFKANYLYNSRFRASMFSQLDAGLVPAPSKVLESVSTVDSEQHFSDIRLPNLYAGEYWGFYLKMDMNFIPDWDLEQDLTYLYVTWDEVEYINENGVEVIVASVPRTMQQPLRVKVRANLKELESMVNESMDRMYSNYPPYLAYYENEV